MQTKSTFRLAGSTFSVILVRSTIDGELSPIWDVRCQQSLEEATVVGNAKMKKLMSNHKVLKGLFALDSSAASVMAPWVEHDPHFVVIR
jgi:hypothetical protein